MRVTDKMLRLLSLLEQGPKYGMQFETLAPDLFFSEKKIGRVNGHQIQLARVQNIHVLLRRAAKNGLAEQMKDFKVARKEEDEPGVARRKYYAITLRGREVLKEARAMLAKA